MCCHDTKLNWLVASGRAGIKEGFKEKMAFEFYLDGWGVGGMEASGGKEGWSTSWRHLTQGTVTR